MVCVWQRSIFSNSIARIRQKSDSRNRRKRVGLSRISVRRMVVAKSRVSDDCGVGSRMAMVTKTWCESWMERRR